ncbi:hypothetical protein Agub_g15484 [Astrephomene gubernaculifera]|uniref:Uncharacterized protein n=1 Tax=Astrephomene gubernaculifera TaxID=47775 RepID=A0AAD3E541_9CHLO|nr:hypothetical protein Agub_g15484 [Astrephomene gubernaculifera]
MRRQAVQHLTLCQPSWRAADVQASVDNPHYRRVLQLEVKGIEVDLLMLPDLVTGRNEDSIKKQYEALMPPVFQQLKSQPEAVRFDIVRERAASEAMTKFINTDTDEVKGVVRLVKAWYKLGLAGQFGVRSIVLEVLVLAALQGLHEQLHSRPPLDKLQLFMATLRLLVGLGAGADSKPVLVDAGEWGYRPELGRRCEHIWGPHPPHYALETTPTETPTMPMYRDADYAGLAREARRVLEVMQDGTFGQLLEESTLGRAVTQLCPWLSC